MKKSLFLLPLLPGLIFAQDEAAAPIEPPAKEAADEFVGTLKFANRDKITGKPQGIDKEGNLQWQAGFLHEPMAVKSTSIVEMRLQGGTLPHQDEGHQALLLLNESEYLKAARNLAQSLIAQRGTEPTDPLADAYETVTSQLPDPRERAILEELVRDLVKTYTANPKLAEELCQGVALNSADERALLAASTVLINTLYNMDVTKTRQ